jgi:membrane-bound metal-dependent hydrolase YbcI (DUF457 family)
VKGSTHAVIGAGSAAAAVWLLGTAGIAVDPVVGVGGSLCAGLAALLPDLDHPTSTASRGIPRRLAGQAVRVALPVLVLAGLAAYFGGPEGRGAVLAGLRPVLDLATLLLAPAIVLMGASVILGAFGHRGATHSLAFSTAAGAAGIVVASALGQPWWWGLFVGWGWLSHVVADALTKRGAPALWWPLRQGR